MKLGTYEGDLSALSEVHPEVQTCTGTLSGAVCGRPAAYKTPAFLCSSHWNKWNNQADRNAKDRGHVPDMRANRREGGKYNDDLGVLRRALIDIVEEHTPIGVRGVGYQAAARHLIPKTDKGFADVAVQLRELRKARRIPFADVIDPTRSCTEWQTYESPADALAELAYRYQQSMFNGLDEVVEVWVEKLGLLGVIEPVCSEYLVPLLACKGFSSYGLLWENLNRYAIAGKPVTILYFGDWDPSGSIIDGSAEDVMDDMEFDREDGEPDRTFERVALHSIEQARELDLEHAFRPTKTKGNKHAKNWTAGEMSCELDAIPATQLRGLVEAAITRHIPPAHLKVRQKVQKQARVELQYAFDSWDSLRAQRWHDEYGATYMELGSELRQMAS